VFLLVNLYFLLVHIEHNADESPKENGTDVLVYTINIEAQLIVYYVSESYKKAK
jgi:hypothetical protein